MTLIRFSIRLTLLLSIILFSLASISTVSAAVRILRPDARPAVVLQEITDALAQSPLQASSPTLKGYFGKNSTFEVRNVIRGGQPRRTLHIRYGSDADTAAGQQLRQLVDAADRHHSFSVIYAEAQWPRLSSNAKKGHSKASSTPKVNNNVENQFAGASGKKNKQIMIIDPTPSMEIFERETLALLKQKSKKRTVIFVATLDDTPPAKIKKRQKLETKRPSRSSGLNQNRK